MPLGLDLNPFVGSSLDQIGIGAHQVSFRFSGPWGVGDARLDVEGKWALYDSNGAVVDRSLEDDQKPSDREAYRIHRVLGHTVLRFALDPPRSLTLTFDDGSYLTVWDDSDSYESFHVEPGGYHI